jgi:hypothetical protein
LRYAVQTGQPAVEMLRGKPMFDFLGDDPEYAKIFNDGMTGVSDMEIPTVLAAYDFSNMGTIVDVGGGHGRLLAAMLRKWPRSRGILIDAESVVAGAPAVLDAAGVADRCAAVGGSFFESVPSGGDAYVLKQMAHDWDDSNALQILRNVRAAMSGGKNTWSSKMSCPTTTANTCRKCPTRKCSSPPRAANTRPTSTPTCRAPPASAIIA